MLLRKLRDQSGQSLVEFSLVLVLFLTALGGAIEFGRAMYQWQALYRAAQLGARTGAMAPESATQIRSAASQAVDTALTPYGFTHQAAEIALDMSRLASEPIRVTVRSPFASPFGTLIPGLANIMLSASASAFYTTVGPARNSSLPVDPVDPPPPSEGGGDSGSDGGSDSSGSGDSSGGGSGDGSSDPGSGDSGADDGADSGPAPIVFE